MRFFYTAVLFLLVSPGVLAQQDSSAEDYPDYVRVVPCVVFNHVFAGDYLMGLGGGIYEEKYNWGARLQFDFRPYFKRVTLAENDTVQHQYKEKDFFLSLGLEKEFRLKRQYPMLLPFAQLNAGLLWGNFKAFEKAPESRWIISPAAGLGLALSSGMRFRLGYQYLKPLVLERSGHRIVFQIIALFNE